MKDLFVLLGAGTLGAIAITAIFLIGPILTIWSINTLAEQSNFNLYIEHNAWSYFAAFVFLVCVRGGK